MGVQRLSLPISRCRICCLVISLVVFAFLYCTIKFPSESPKNYGGIYTFGWVAAAASPSKRCLYNVLEVSRTDSLEVIKKAYRKLSMKFHPDKNKAPDAQDRFKEIAHAYQVLSDKEKRNIYDLHGHEGVAMSESGMADAHDPFDIFSHFFNPGGGSHHTQRPRTPPITMKLRVTLEQIYFGEPLHVKFTRTVLCPRAEECYIRRGDCQGPGIRTVTQQMGPRIFVQNQIEDPVCVETGKGWNPRCSACPNGQTIAESISLTAYVEQGMSTGRRITFEGAGEQRIGQEAGDLVLVIDELVHKRFIRDGNDLRAEMKITLLEALIGFENPFEHLNGKPMQISKKDVTSHGEVVVFRNHGMPKADSWAGDSGRFGDLYLKFAVVYPSQLTDGQKKLIQEALQSVTPKTASL